MDLVKQRKLEPFRYIPILGGIALLALGFFLARHDRQLILSLIVGLPVAGGLLLVSLGFASIKLRRTIFSQEERIQNLEKKLLNGAGESQQQGS
ncbi:MAG: hypothetical protein ACYSU0_01315 [Planctomycetota bacterium]|jgi:hypothetical protein